MGDARFARPYEMVRDSTDRAAAVKALSDVQVIEALAQASRHQDPLLANVLATEASNRMHRAMTIQENVADGLISVNAHGTITSINRAAERMLGWPRGDLLGKDKHRTVHYKDDRGRPLPREECRMLHVLETGEIIEYERDIFTRRDGTAFPVSYTAAPIHADGRIEGLVVAFRDITERRHHEGTRDNWLNLVEAFYHVHDALGIGMVILDNGRVHYANQAFHTLLGYAPHEMDGLDFFSLVAPHDRPAFQAHLATLLLDPTSKTTRKTTIQRHDGTTFTANLSIAKVDHEPADVTRMVCVVNRVGE